jgi:WD40 repeat protein
METPHAQKRRSRKSASQIALPQCLARRQRSCNAQRLGQASVLARLQSQAGIRMDGGAYCLDWGCKGTASYKLAFSGATGVIYLGDARANEADAVKAMFAIWSHNNIVYDLKWTPDNHLITASGDSQVHVTDVETRKCVLRLTGHSASVKSVDVNPRNTCLLLSSSRDGSFAVYDTRVEQGHVLRERSAHDSTGRKWCAISEKWQMTGPPLTCASWLPDGCCMLTAGQDGCVHLWDLRGGRANSSSSSGSSSGSSANNGRVASLLLPSDINSDSSSSNSSNGSSSISSSGKRKYSGSCSGSSSNSSSSTSSSSSSNWCAGQRIGGHTLRPDSGTASMDISEDGSRLLLGVAGGDLYYCNLANCFAPAAVKAAAPPVIHTYTRRKTAANYFIKAKLSPCGDFVLSGCASGSAYIWQTNTPAAPAVQLQGHEGEVTGVAWCTATHEPRCATVSDDDTMRLWIAADTYAPCEYSTAKAAETWRANRGSGGPGTAKVVQQWQYEQERGQEEQQRLQNMRTPLQQRTLAQFWRPASAGTA